jgi:hypothetical protein
MADACPVAAASPQNSKSEARNPKQIQKVKTQTQAAFALFGFGFRALSLFRVSGFGFRILGQSGCNAIFSCSADRRRFVYVLGNDIGQPKR